MVATHEHVLGSDDGTCARRLEWSGVAALVSWSVIDDKAATAYDWRAHRKLGVLTTVGFEFVYALSGSVYCATAGNNLVVILVAWIL